MLPLSMLLWLLAVQGCALAVLPVALRVFNRLPDRGYTLSKPLGLLAWSYAVWLPAMLGFFDYTRATAIAALALLVLVCWWGRADETLGWLRREWRRVALAEATLAAFGALAVFVRAHNPDIIGQEKFMDLAFFHGYLAANALPAEDTWLAGYGMPYYPFGYFMLGLPSKLAGLPAVYGYNLALVLVFALTVLASAGLVANLLLLLSPAPAEPRGQVLTWLFGLAGALLVAVCGNLVGPLEVLAARGFGSAGFWSSVGVKGLRPVPGSDGWLPDDGGWWWRASRVIPTIQPDGITEFPYFSFLLGDLHPHFTALPLLLLVTGLALVVLLEGRPLANPVTLLTSALVLGALIVTNTWDVATFWLLFGLATFAVAWRLRGGAGGRFWRPLTLGLAPIAGGIALFCPYFVGYTSQRLGLALVNDRTPLASLLILFGPLFALVALLALRVGGRAALPRGSGLVWVVGLVAMLVVWAIVRPAAALPGALLLLLVLGADRVLTDWRDDEGSAWRGALLFLLGLAGLALAVIVGAELIFIRDSFGTRMNTVFKFYYHVWLLLGLVAAPAAALAIGRSQLGSPGAPWRVAGLLVLGLALVLGLVYPLGATWTKSNAFRGQPTLDGAAFLERSRPADAAAIRWLAGQPDRPVVLEAVGNDYEEFARVSTFSGLPTVIGWIGHELQWRGELDEYNRRQEDVNALYQRAEPGEGMRILTRYRVRYVFVGALERQKYGPQVEQRLASWLTPVFRSEGAVVFAVPRAEGAS